LIWYLLGPGIFSLCFAIAIAKVSFFCFKKENETERRS